MKNRTKIRKSNLKLIPILAILIFVQIVFIIDIKGQNGIVVENADFTLVENLYNSTELDDIAQDVDPKITVEYADAVITNELSNSTDLHNTAQDVEPKITVEYADGIISSDPEGSQELNDLAQDVDPRIIVEYADAIIKNDFGSSDSSIGILNFYESLMDIDPLSRELLKAAAFCAVSRLGKNIWDFLGPDKYYLEFEWDISKSVERLFGFAPRFNLRVWYWKEGHEIHIKLHPKILFNPNEDCNFFKGPLASIQNMMNSLINRLDFLEKFHLDWEFDFGVEGYLEYICNTETNEQRIDPNLKIWIEFTVIGHYLPWLCHLSNPFAAEILMILNEAFEKVSGKSFLDLCTGELQLRIEASTGYDSDGNYLQVDVKPRFNALVLDIDLDGDPELEASCWSSLSFKWNRLGFGWAGEVMFRLLLNPKLNWFNPLKYAHFLWEFPIITYDSRLYAGGGGGAGSMLYISSDNQQDTDLDGLIDYYENILGTSIDDTDSDNDMVSDYYEVIYGTNWLSPDTDNDQLSDYDEIAVYNTNPLKGDTDGDGIIDIHEINGYYGGVFTSPILNDTDQDGLSDSEESKAINPANPGTNASAYDTDGDGYSDGNEVDKYLTDPLNILDVPLDTDSDGMPDIDENIVGTDPNFDEYSIDTDLDEIPDIIEELLFQTNSSSLDSDNDGVNDNFEILNGTNPNNPLDYPGANYTYPDTDGDGLPDIIEDYLFFTNNNSGDTDGDSYNDYEEIVWGSDPNDAFSIPGFIYQSNFDDIENLKPQEEEYPIIPGYEIIPFMIILAGTVLIAFFRKIKISSKKKIKKI